MKPIKPICRYALAATALICAVWLAQSPAVKQRRAEAAACTRADTDARANADTAAGTGSRARAPAATRARTDA